MSSAKSIHSTSSIAIIKNQLYENIVAFILNSDIKLILKKTNDQVDVISKLMLQIKFMGNCMMTSSNGNIFRVTGHLWGEFTGHQ